MSAVLFRFFNPRYVVAFILAISCSVSVFAFERIKSYAYFDRQYGDATERDTVDCLTLHHESRYLGTAAVVANFQRSTYRRGDVSIICHYYGKDLVLAQVSYSIPRPWTEQEVRGILESYGKNWRDVRADGVTLGYKSDDGTIAWLTPPGQPLVVSIETPLAVALARAEKVKQDERERLMRKLNAPREIARTN